MLCYVMLCYITYNIKYVMLYNICQHNTTRYITYVMLYNIKYVMLYNICQHNTLYNTLFNTL